MDDPPIKKTGERVERPEKQQLLGDPELGEAPEVGKYGSLEEMYAQKIAEGHPLCVRARAVGVTGDLSSPCPKVRLGLGRKCAVQLLQRRFHVDSLTPRCQAVGCERRIQKLRIPARAEKTLDAHDI
eukprot:1190432-Prorocentrum_minimum.AAC.3